MIQKCLVLILGLLVCQIAMTQEASSPDNWRRFRAEQVFGSQEQTEVDFLWKVDSQEELNAMVGQGWIVMRKLDRETYIIRKPAGFDTAQIPNEFNLLPANDLWKLSPNFDSAIKVQKQSDFVLKSLDVAETLDFLSKQGVEASLVYAQFISVSNMPSDLLQQLIKRPEVIYIGAESQQARVDSRVLDMNLNPNRVNLIHDEYTELRGQQMVLSIREDGYNINDIDLIGRNLNSELSATTNSNHATEMATIAAGTGSSSLNGRGVAGKATLTSSFLNALFPDTDQAYADLKVSVQNHSYGTEELENFYGAGAEAYDLSANANPALLHVFSIGNSGEETPESGSYAGIEGMANLTGNFKASKNTLSVGSVDTVGRKVAFVSNGPANDGRIKPELSAYSVFGSSNSAALVAGVSLLLQQAYLESEGSLPASALVKALLINGARDVGERGPDYLTGFGNVDAYRSLQDMNAGRFASGTVANAETEEVTINIPTGAVNLKVTLVWNDPAAAANANLALVHDLDLLLEDAATTIWQPWVLNPATDRLTAAATRGVDQLNNVEQVTIDNPVPGALTVRVTGSNIAGATQDYHLAWTWEMANEFAWTYPSASDNMPYNGETTGYFRWESTLSEMVGSLEYSTDGGLNWQLIDDQVVLSEGQYRWQPPDLKTAAMARMRVGAQSFDTQTFTISRPERIAVGFSCADSVRIQWNSLANAYAYEVLNLGDTEMELVASTADTAFTFNKSDFSNRFFAVQPVLDGGVRPVRSATFDYDFQGVGCYLLSFFTELDPEQGVFLNLNLGTPAGVTEVDFQREADDGSFESVGTLGSNALDRNIRFLDAQPFQGLNNYRVRLQFKNGESITSEISSAYFLTSRPFLVFPNPLPRGELLNVFSRTFEDEQEVTLSLFDKAGNKAFDLTLNSDRFAFNLSLLPAGIYTYRIVTEGLSHTGRVILN